MANLNPSSDISTYIQTIFEDAMFVARENMFIDMLITTFDDREGNADRSSSEYSEATISNIGETDDLASQAFTPSVLATLTPAEAGAQIFLPDLRVESDPFPVRNDAAIELGSSMADKIQTDTLTNLGSLTGGTIGAAGTTITWGHFFAAKAVLKGAKVPAPYSCVLHEYQWFVLAKSAAVSQTVTNAPEFQDEVMRRYYVGTVGEVDIFTTADITIDGSDDAKGGMFNSQALALDMRRPPRLEPERDASRRGWELNQTTVFAHGVWRPAYGVTMYFDAATPTS
jgi:hypothetical protein